MKFFNFKGQRNLCGSVIRMERKKRKMSQQELVSRVTTVKCLWKKEQTVAFKQKALSWNDRISWSFFLKLIIKIAKLKLPLHEFSFAKATAPSKSNIRLHTLQ